MTQTDLGAKAESDSFNNLLVWGMPKPPKGPPKRPASARDKIEIEPGADKRLANILKKALNTPPAHRAEQPPKRTKSTKHK